MTQDENLLRDFFEKYIRKNFVDTCKFLIIKKKIIFFISTPNFNRFKRIT